MPIRKRFRRIAIAAGVALGLAMAIWFSMPLWFPWVLGPLTRSQGIHFKQYERIGYGRFALHEVSLTNKNLTLNAGSFEAFVPHAWLWRLRTGSSFPGPIFLQVNDLHLDIHVKGGGKTSTSDDVKQATSILQLVRRWVPLVTVTNGNVQISGISIQVPGLAWSNGQIDGRVLIPRVKQQARLSADLRRPELATIDLTGPKVIASIQVQTKTMGFDMNGTTRWEGNTFRFTTHFGQQGKLPETAELSGTNLSVSAGTARLPNYEDPHGNVVARWEKGQFTVDVRASARPVSTETNLPPLELTLTMGGDTNTAVIREARVSAPWLYAELTRELSVYFNGQLLREPAKLRVSADLGGQPWLPLKGILNGDAQFTPTFGKYPLVEFRVKGLDIGNEQLQAADVELSGSLEWPALRLTSGRAKFSDGSEATVIGHGNLLTRNIEESTLGFSGALAKRWLPKRYSYDSLSMEASLRGSPTNLIHSGQLKAGGVTLPQLRPLGIEAAWEGRQLNLKRFKLGVSAGSSLLDVEGALAFGGRTNLMIRTARLSKADLVVLELQAPFDLELAQGTGAQLMALQLQPVHLSGSAGALQVEGNAEWPRAGWLRCSARNLEPGLVQEFLASPLPNIRLNHLALSGGWTNAPVVFDLNLGLTIITNPVLNASLQLAGNHTGVSVKEFAIADTNSPIAQGQGFLPLALVPTAPAHPLQLLTNAPLQAELSSQLRGPWVESFLQRRGFRVREPHLNVKLSGSWQEPAGFIEVSAKALERPSQEKMPSLTDLQVAIEVNRHEIRLTNSHLLVQGEPISIRGSLPMGDAFWKELSEKRLPDWREVSAEVKTRKINLTVFSELYPEFISPQGTLEMDLRLERGGALNGSLQVTDARTRPLPEIGPARDVQLKILFENRVLRIEDTSARIGGALVNISGRFDLSGTNWYSEKLPPFSLAIGGKNVPLVRRPETMIRSDLVLSLSKTNGAPPIIQGVVQPQEGYLLSDLGDLVPGSVAEPKRRPPYFSIEHPLFSDWRLAVRVNGTRFLKARSPLFNGEISADLTLQGTLKEPLALGNMKIDSGLVRFPFGSLEVQQGLVTIAGENPYQPQLSVSAQSKQYGYDIRMEVTGTASAPIIQFSSTPPLASEQILLLLTAGEIPSGEYTLTAQQRAQTLAMFLGREMLSKLGFGDASAQRLTIHSGEEISETGRPTYRIEFKLTDDWSLVAEYDRFGDFNMGAQWRFYSK
jgi:translocation and assembly module TamB